MSLRIHTGNTSADRLLEAARPLFYSSLQMLNYAGDVLFLGENTVEKADLKNAAAILLFYSDENWTSTEYHRQLSEKFLYAALPLPVSLEKLEQTLLQLCSHPIPESHPAPRLELSANTKTVRCGDKEIQLTDKEFRLFSVLWQHLGQAVSRTVLVQEVWPDGTDGNSCEVYLTHLRKKLGPVLGDSVITSVRGKGYILRLP